MSLTEAIQNCSPIIWVDTTEPERLIGQVPVLFGDRAIYVYDALEGLLQWDRKSSQWKIVLITVTDPETEEKSDITIQREDMAWMYVTEQKNAVFIVRNAHKSINDMLTLFSTFYGKWRNAFWQDNAEKIPLQTILLSVNEPCPPELSSMTTSISYGIPTKTELASIIQYVRQHTNDDIIADEDIAKVAESSAGMTEFEAIDTYLSLIRKTNKIDKVEVARLKFERMKNSSTLDICKPQFSLDDIGGLEGAKKLIRQAKWIKDNSEQAAEFKVSPLRRVLLMGVSGCGKSLICEAAAHELDLDLAKVGVSKAMNKFIGQSEANIRSMFAQINALSPIAVWIDEMGRDLSGGASSDYTDGGTTSRVHGTFLTEMQELNKDVYLFGAANDISSLAPEMLRADRFDKIMFVGFPSYEERMDIFRLNLAINKEDTEAGIRFNIPALAFNTSCFTGAEIKSLINRVRFDISTSEHRAITTEDILAFIPLEKNRIWVRHKPLTMAMYQQAVNDYEWASETQRIEADYIKRGDEPNGQIKFGHTSQPKATVFK